jgi:hypothetical protein
VTYLLHKLMKKGGWYWWYRTYASEDAALKGMEQGMRVGNNGLWADPQPVLPWE